MKTCYLGGPITSTPYTWEWRKAAKRYLEDRNILSIDPLRGKDLNSIKGQGFESNIPGSIFTARDYLDLNTSDFVLCNLLYIPKRQSIGTFMELGYAVAKNIPFTVVATDSQFLLHPFLTEGAINVVSTLEEGLSTVEFILMEA